MKKKLEIVVVIGLLISIIDQYTKWIIVTKMAYGTKYVVSEHFFDIIHARNKGAAFGMFHSWDTGYRDVFFYGISILAFCFLYYFIKQIPEKHKWSTLPIGLIFGGAIGNLTDRIFRGSVVDFFSFHWYDRTLDWQIFGKVFQIDLIWPAFNVADSAITVGVFWLLCVMSFHHTVEKKQLKKSNS